MSRTLSRGGLLLALAFALLLPGAPDAEGQSTTRRPVRRGDVTGVEMQLEGALHATRGGTLRWSVVAYEVVGLDQLRPAAGAEIRIATSLTPGELAAEVTADRRGRALVEIEVPEDAPERFGATVVVHARRGVSRRFELGVSTQDPRTLRLMGAAQVTPGGALPVFGRYAHADGPALAGETLELTLRDGRGPLGAPVRVETDAGGVFTHTFAIPRDAEGALQVRATGPRDDARRQVHAQHAATLLAPSEPPLVVQLAPAQGQWLVAPNADVRFDVVVRRADGRPVSNARVRLHRPVPLTAELDQDRRDPWVLTDARGRAQLEWEAPRLRQGWRDVSVTAHAGKAGVGQGSGGAQLRVAASRHGARLAVEGGALTPELGGRVFVRVATVDGRPAPAGVPVKLVGPRVGEVEGQTDESGVAALDVSLRDPAEDDRCGGEAATAARVFVAGAQTADSYCLAVDPDAAARVHATPAHPTAGQEIQVEVARTRAARGLPIVLTALRRVGDRLEAVGVAVLEDRQDAATITLPEDAIGEVLLRARPLVGRSLQEARGALTSLYVEPGPGLALEARARGELDAVRAELSATGEPASLLALAVPLGQAGSLEQQTAGLVAGPFGRLPESPTDALYAALLAERTPMDVAAPVVLRGRDLEPQPEPTNPTRLGLLRDPWRASSRFVEGRLALVFRAIEARVDQAVPEELDEVAVEERGRFRFNRQLLASLASGSLGSEGATGLGGEPLTIERLEGLDRAFDYDHVARRITRKRLFKVLLALRSFVQQSALDLAWTRPGDPTLWLERLRNRGVPGLGSLQPRELVDGWGRPFQLRETARARFSRVQPVAGYELVSAGPDGRYGNGDDLVDPTARVLPAGSLYAEAVGEDALVARLQGVELGRATLAMAAGAFSAPQPRIAPPPDDGPRQTNLGTLPPLFEPPDFPLAIRRPTEPADARLVRAEPGSVRLEVDREPRTWRFFAVGFTARGRAARARGGARAGAPVLSDLALPSRLRVGERLTFPLHLTNVTEEAAQYAFAVEAEGVEVALDGSELSLPAGESRSVAVTLTGTTPGRHPVQVGLAQGEQVVREVRRRVAVDRGLHPIRRRVAGLVGEEGWEVDFPLPEDAEGAQARVVLVAPTALAADPDFHALREDDPALVAWFETLVGRRPAESLRAALLRQQDPGGAVRGEEAALSTAAAIVAWSAALDDEGRPDAEAQAARARAVRRLGALGAFRDSDGRAGRLRMQAAVVGALATSGLGSLDVDPARHADPVVRTLRGWLPQLRRALRDVPGEPTLLARAAGALLLADPRDGHGRAMLAEALEQVGEDGLVKLGETRRGVGERVTATLALAVAAHQARDGEAARRLLDAAAAHTPSIARQGGEPAFWWFAAGAYGALGGAAPERVRFEADGEAQEMALEDGRAFAPFAIEPGETVTLEAASLEGERAPVLVRFEAVFGRRFAARRDAPFRLELEGDVGGVGRLAALELRVSATTAVDDGVLDLQLPGGVEAEDALLRSLEANAMVRSAEARNPGFVRLRLAPFAAEQSAPIPVPLHWQASGTVTGLGVVAYPEADPDQMTVLAPREWNVP